MQKKVSHRSEQIIKAMKTESIFNDVIKLVSGTSIAQVLGIMAAPILTRLYDPEAFGLLALFTSITGVLGIATCLRYNLSIMLPRSDDEAANQLGICFVAVLIVSLFCIPLIWLGKGQIIHWLNAPGLAFYLWVIPPTVFVFGIFLALKNWNTRMRNFGQLSVARAGTTVATTSISIGGGYAGYATGGTLIWANVFGQVIVTAFLGIQTFMNSGGLFQKEIRFDKMLRGLKKYKKFPLIEMPGAIINAIAQQAPPIVLAFFFPQTYVGYFALTIRIVHLPMTFIGGALSQVFFQRASAVREDKYKLAGLTEKMFISFINIALFPAVLLTILGRDLFAMILGHNWAEAGIYAQILGPWLFVWFISAPLSTLFVVMERQELALIIHTSIFISRFVSLVCGGILSNIYLGLILFSASGVCVYGMLAVWNLSLAGVNLRSIAYRSLWQVLYCALAATLLVAAKFCSVKQSLLLSFGFILFFMFYILFMRKDFFKILKIIRGYDY